jgi:hypothetical protein
MAEPEALSNAGKLKIAASPLPFFSSCGDLENWNEQARLDQLGGVGP